MDKSILELLQNRYTCKAWAQESVTLDQLSMILRAAHLAPSKMAMAQHHIVALTNSSEGRAIKEWLFWQHTWAEDGHPAWQLPKDHTPSTPRDYNGQYRAPVVLFWVGDLKPSERRAMADDSDHMIHTPDENQQRADIYISATAALLQAEQLGLHTGFGVCHHTQQVATRLGLTGQHAIVALGVGHAQQNLDQMENLTVPIHSAQGEPMGRQVANIPATHPEHFNRNWRPTYAEMVKII